MNASQSRTKTVVAAAVGVGILAGAAGLFAYFSVEHSKRQRAFQHKINRNSNVQNGNRGNESDSEEEDRMSRATDSTEFFDCCSDREEMGDVFAKEKEEEEGGKELFDKVDELLRGDDEKRQKGFELLRENEGTMSENPEYLWRYAKAHQIKAIAYGYEKKENAKKEYISKGLELAAKALRLEPNNPDAHKWFAILTGMLGDYLTVKEKVVGAKEFYSHVDIAIQMKPNDYSLHHLLGRFKFEVANTSWMQKKLATAIFGTIPDFTFSEAMENLLKAESLSPTPWIENRLLLGKCCISQNLVEDAAHWFRKALKVCPRTLEDSCLLDEAKLLLEKC